MGLGIERSHVGLPALGQSVQAVDPGDERLEEELADTAEESFQLRPRLPGAAGRPLAGAGPRQEPKRRVERLAELVHLEDELHQVVGIGGAHSPAIVPARSEIARAAGGPSREGEVLVLPEGGGPPLRVDAGEGVFAQAERIAARGEHPEAQVLAGVIGSPPGEEVRRSGQLRVGGLDVQGGDRPGTGAAKQLQPGVDGGHLALDQPHPPRIERDEVRREPRAEGEEVRALQEERPLLGEEERESRQVDLPRVDLGLGEIGVDGQDRAEARA